MITARQKLEEALNASDDLFCELQDKLNALCEELDLDPERYSFYIAVHEE